MSQEFHAFLKKEKLPPTKDVARALSSRGWRVETDTEQPIDELSTLKLTVDGTPVSVSLQVSRAAEGSFAPLIAAAQTSPQGEVWLGLLKATDTRIVCAGEGEKGDEWARELARGLGLVCAGGFHNPQTGAVLQYGR